MTNNTLVFITTHIINYAVISEYKKMKQVKDCDVILLIDNTNLKIKTNARIAEKEFFGTKVNCFFFDKDVHNELNLSWYNYNSVSEKFNEIMWYSSDSRFYYVRKYFPDYEYYWQFEFDVFCNGESYQTFFDKYADRTEDCLLLHFRKETLNGEWYWSNHIDWLYKDKTIYGSLFPIVKLSGKAIDFLYDERIKQKGIYEKLNDKMDSFWIFCEVFTPTELMNNGFSVYGMTENHITYDDEIDLNTERIFERPDNELYHPIKGQYPERLKKLQEENEQLKARNKELGKIVNKSLFYKIKRIFK